MQIVVVPIIPCNISPFPLRFKFIAGEAPFTFCIDDPLSRSKIDRMDDIPSDFIAIEEYQRAEREDEEFGLDHTEVDWQVDHPEFDPFHVTDQDGEPFKQYQAQFDVEEWYDVLKDETFPTDFVPISHDIARLIVDAATNAPLPDSDAMQSFRGDIEKRLRDGKFVIRLSSRSPKDAVEFSEKFKEILERKFSEISEDRNADDIAWYDAMMLAMPISSFEEAFHLLTT
eukprot:TRINITY_DN6985_c0_g1_i2.p1 TRINITY_DN6985_c0_g1~~TRINITY_DN6985_c0_g1_i2.p1  ORF type:complete len:228 (+),score=82.33 TRINITY_DN6985_c0_g1_i2:286-969(+)